jgi:hypothetical protein
MRKEKLFFLFHLKPTQKSPSFEKEIPFKKKEKPFGDDYILLAHTSIG